MSEFQNTTLANGTRAFQPEISAATCVQVPIPRQTAHTILAAGANDLAIPMGSRLFATDPIRSASGWQC